MSRFVKKTLIVIKNIGNMLIFPILILIVGVIIVLSVGWNILLNTINIGSSLFMKPTVNINEIKYVINDNEIVRPSIGEKFAKLKIQSINLSADIIHGDSDEELRQGVGHYSGSTLPGEGGNVVLCAHRDTAFRTLENVKVNDEVDIETGYGNYKYKVAEIKIIKDMNDTSPLQPSDNEKLTMYTCYPFSYIGSAPYRIVFECDFIECV